MAEVISVSALNQYVKTLLDANDILFDLALRGEIANFVQNSRSGHCYFSLRDEASSVPIPTADFILPSSPSPASVTPK